MAYKRENTEYQVFRYSQKITSIYFKLKLKKFFGNQNLLKHEKFYDSMIPFFEENLSGIGHFPYFLSELFRFYFVILI